MKGINGAVVVVSRIFGEIIKNLPENTVEIKSDDRNFISIVSGSASYNIKGNNANEYPKIPIIENSSKVILSQAILKKMITKTIFAVSKDDTRQSLTGCCLESDGSTITMVAIDDNGKPTPVPELEIKNEMQQCRFDAGLARKNLRMEGSHRPSCDINQMIGESLGAGNLDAENKADKGMVGELSQRSNAK